MITEEEFKKVASNFDKFLHENGYIRPKEYAKLTGEKVQRVRHRCWSGQIKNVYLIGQDVYILKDANAPLREDVRETVSYFEEFMRGLGYIRTEDLAAKEFTSRQNIFYKYKSGQYKDAYMIGRIVYIRE